MFIYQTGTVVEKYPIGPVGIGQGGKNQVFWSTTIRIFPTWPPEYLPPHRIYQCCL